MQRAYASTRRWIDAGLAALAIASLAVALAPLGWPFELFAHFRWQLAVATVTFIVVASIASSRSRRVTVLVVFAILLQATPALWPGHAPQPGRDCEGPALRVATVNLWYRGRDTTHVLAWLAAHPADVVVLQEVTAEWSAALEAVADLYPHRAMHARQDPYGIGVLSRWPLVQVDYADFAGDGLPSLVATVDVAGRHVRVIGLHTPWPMLARLQRARDRALVQAAAKARESTLPTVIAGDLNLTPYAPAFRRFERAADARDAFANRLWRPTWQAGFWPLALPIDHVLVPAGACVQSAVIGEDVGSDHRPVFVALRWP
jgi:endonuclease/exonuclease/phosphatase (EEP) superfamily protein YafD